MKRTICNNIGKFKSLVDFRNAFPDEKSCITYLEHQLWPNGEPISPFDPTSKVYLGIESKGKLDGEVELDETFVGGKNKNRHKNKKVKNSQGRSFKDKTPVMGILQRGSCVVCKVIDNTIYKQLTGPVLRKVKLSATVYSDEWQGYKLINKVYKKHHVVDHGHGIYVNGCAYTNTIEAFWSNYCKRHVQLDKP